MRRLRMLSLLLAIAVVGIAAGCGGDDDEEAAAPAETATETEAAGGGQTVDMTEYEFGPNDVTVSQDETITAETTGNIAHNLAIEEGPDPNKPSNELAATPDVQPGDSAELTVDLDPGEYALVCTVPGHREQGMIGTIKVE
ncbi:MAG: plastocyanin/azurin family copper-binding protein [Solirubrobacterales bacterium]